MKTSLKWYPLLACLVASLLLAACVPLRALRGSGEIVTQEMAITNFARVEVHHAFQVAIRQGEPFRVVIEVDEAVIPYLQVAKQGNTLQIGLESSVTFMGNVTLRGEITMPTLNGLSASGASEVDVSGFQSDEGLELNASGASALRGAIDAGDTHMNASGASQITLNGSLQAVSLEASGASRITLNGTGHDATIHASGGSRVDLAEFPVTDAAVEASGGSTVIVHPSGRLDAEASGGSDISYLGEPSLGNVQSSGGSSVTKQ